MIRRILAVCIILFIGSINARPAIDKLKVPVSDKARLLDILLDCEFLQKEIFTPGRFQPLSPTGAAGANLLLESGERDYWFIESQRIAGDRLEAGIVNKILKDDDYGLIAAAIKELDWAFDRQGEDGGFPGSRDPFHSTEIFAESTARGLLLIRQSGLQEYQYIVDKYLEQIHKTGIWLIDSQIAKEGKIKNQPYTHRKYIICNALATIGFLTNDTRLSEAALDYAKEGLALMTRDGLSPELGGVDASYMDAGALLAMRYRLICPDKRVKKQLAYMSEKTLEYVSARVSETGEVNTEGDTRVGGSHTHRDGSPKLFNYSEVIVAFCLGYYTLGNPEWLNVAQKISKAGVHKIYMK